MSYFGHFYLDKEKDIIVEMDREGDEISWVLRTPNHGTGNLITNLAALCHLPLSLDENGLKIIRGTLPCYVDGQNRTIYFFRLLDTKIANIFPDGTIERRASIPAIAKTLMSQTKDYTLDFRKTVMKTWILRECKFRTDLHTHMNANLEPDLLIALGIHHQLRYPLYYIRKLGLRCSPTQEALLAARREKAAAAFRDSPLRGKYLDRKINDATFINFASLILENLENAKWNLPRIRASLAVMKDGQAVFTNLEKVYIYRYVFCKGTTAEDPIPLKNTEAIPDEDIVCWLRQMAQDRDHPVYRRNTLLQDKLLWIARSYARYGIDYAEISDTTLVKPGEAPEMLSQVHAVMPTIRAETGVTLRFLAAIRRTPLTILKDRIAQADTVRENLRTLQAIAGDPFVAGCDIVGEEINDIRDLSPLLREITVLAQAHPTFTIRVHAGENDSLRENVANTIRCIRAGMAPGQSLPQIRIGHGLYTTNLASAKGQALLRDLKDSGAVLEFQITSNVRLNNLSAIARHPLRQYLAAGISCVQGTDGGALYGTDSLDEQLALEKLLNLTHSELMAMRSAEERVRSAGIRALTEKGAAFQALRGATPVREFYEERIRAQGPAESLLLDLPSLRDSAAVFADQIRELPLDRVPVILIGGSFNNDRHLTRPRKEIRAMLDQVLETGDPKKMFLVIGHSLAGYEQYIAQRNRGRFDLYAFVPAQIGDSEAARLQKSGAGIRVSIEPSPMGVYKSFAYEIFKRRPSVLLALDGNSSAANMIQEAKNGKRRCHIFVFDRARMLKEKAKNLQGYASLFHENTDLAGLVCRAVETAYPEKWYKADQAL
ncbi:MAG: adenosine deaminase [Clostridia bacterium]|nr:adenosine deaminase [Clostridia bacterium]